MTAGATHYQGHAAIQAYAQALIDAQVHAQAGFDGPGQAIWDHVFGSGHDDSAWAHALNAARYLPVFATYLQDELCGSMFDGSFGALAERTGDSLVAAAFADLVADEVLKALGSA